MFGWRCRALEQHGLLQLVQPLVRAAHRRRARRPRVRAVYSGATAGAVLPGAVGGAALLPRAFGKLAGARRERLAAPVLSSA